MGVYEKLEWKFFLGLGPPWGVEEVKLMKGSAVTGTPKKAGGGSVGSRGWGWVGGRGRVSSVVSLGRFWVQSSGVTRRTFGGPEGNREVHLGSQQFYRVFRDVLGERG